MKRMAVTRPQQPNVRWSQISENLERCFILFAKLSSIDLAPLTVRTAAWLAAMRARKVPPSNDLLDGSHSVNLVGFDPPTGAQLADGWWRWRPGTTHDVLRLTRTAAPGDWRLCTDGTCRPVTDYLAAPGEAVIEITACPAPR